MQSKRGRDNPRDTWVMCGRVPNKFWNIFRPVSSRGKEPGEDNDSLGATFHTAIEGLLDGGQGKFHVSGFDDLEVALLAEAFGGIVEQGVTFRAAGAMIDEQDGSVGTLHGDAHGGLRR